MEFTEEEIRDVFKLLSAVLQMGNIEFMTAGGAQITSKEGKTREYLDVVEAHIKHTHTHIYIYYTMTAQCVKF